MKPDQTLGFQQVHRFLSDLFDGDLHAKRVLSLANATLGVVRTASLAVNTIGHGLALARGLVTALVQGYTGGCGSSTSSSPGGCRSRGLAANDGQAED